MDKQALIKAIEAYRENCGQYNGDWQQGFTDGTEGVIEMINKLQTIRPEIMEFAEAMEAEMANHEQQKILDIQNMPLGQLITKANCESFQLEMALFGNDIPDYEEINHYSMDLGLYAMMIWHKAKGEQ